MRCFADYTLVLLRKRSIDNVLSPQVREFYRVYVGCGGRGQCEIGLVYESIR
jgi:hypothetical protein